MWLAIQNIKLYFVFEIVIASSLWPQTRSHTLHCHCGDTK